MLTIKKHIGTAMKKCLPLAFALLQFCSLKTFAYSVAYESTTFNFRFGSAVADGERYYYDDILSGGLLELGAPTASIQQYSSYSGDALAATDVADYSGGPMNIYSSVLATAVAGDEWGVADAYVEKMLKVTLKNTSNFTFDEINFIGYYSTLWPTSPLVPYEGDIALDVYKWAAMVDDHNFGGASYDGFLQYPEDAGYGTGCDTDHPDMSEPYPRNYEVTPTSITCAIRGEPPVHNGGFTIKNLAPGEEYTLTFLQSAHATAYAVPEPAPLALLAWGFAGFAVLRRRERKMKLNQK